MKWMLVFTMLCYIVIINHKNITDAIHYNSRKTNDVKPSMPTVLNMSHIRHSH